MLLLLLEFAREPEPRLLLARPPFFYLHSLSTPAARLMLLNRRPLPVDTARYLPHHHCGANEVLQIAGEHERMKTYTSTKRRDSGVGIPLALCSEKNPLHTRQEFCSGSSSSGGAAAASTSGKSSSEGATLIRSSKENLSESIATENLVHNCGTNCTPASILANHNTVIDCLSPVLCVSIRFDYEVIISCKGAVQVQLSTTIS